MSDAGDEVEVLDEADVLTLTVFELLELEMGVISMRVRDLAGQTEALVIIARGQNAVPFEALLKKLTTKEEKKPCSN